MAENKKFLDENGLLYYHGKNKEALAKKVDKVSGKDLSTNDYTNEDKNKLASVATNAQENIIESIEINGVTATVLGKKASVSIEAGKIDEIRVNGSAQAIVNKAVEITVPTKVSDLNNDSNYATIDQIPTDNSQLNNGAGYITSTSLPKTVSELINDSKYQNNEQVQSAINTALAGITGIEFKIVETLPSVGQGKTGVIYLVAHQHAEADTYDEYIWLKGDSTAGTQDRFEKIGSTDIDLSTYWNENNLTIISNADIDKILAK